jgi:hypothetical protein
MSEPDARALSDDPVLSGAIVAGLDRRVLIHHKADVEALAGAQIDEPTVGVNPLLCARPVAIEQLDGRSGRSSAPFNVDTLSGREGRSGAKYPNTVETPILGKGHVAREGA